ncbi:MAG: ATP-dependent DNA helicase [bacterium]|nr:ATP-dependent DNA helicase [bacterium]
MTHEEQYAQLNKDQKQAVDTIDGPLMVLAGPGTGKTQLLSVRTANILRMTDLYPSNILILTYTNAGVKAMRERLAKMIGTDGYSVVVETFHGFSNTLISESEEAIALKGDRVEMTDLERIKVLEYLLDHLESVKPIRPPGAPYLYRGDIQTNISALKRDGISPEDLEAFLRTYKPDGKIIEEKHLAKLKAFAKVYEAYEEAKSPQGNFSIFDKRGRYDYDDMIQLATRTLQTEAELLAQYQEQFQYVMVDEFQDTNGAQLNLLRTLFPDPSANICVVGDDDQSIYRFQGASVGNFELFNGWYPNSTKIVLHKNYRSTPEIIEKSTQIIRQIPEQERLADKKLEAHKDAAETALVTSHRFGTPEEELSFLVQEMKKMSKEDANDSAVLVRTRRQAQDVIEACLQAGIPYSTDGKEDIRGEFRIQQLLKVLRLAEGNLEFEEKDLLLFEILLSDFWEIDHHDLMSFAAYVSKKKSEYRERSKRKQNKKTKEYQLEERQHQLIFDSENQPGHSFGSFTPKPSLFTEFLLRFPLPERIRVKDHEAPTAEETKKLSICSELSFRQPLQLHKAAWVLFRLTTRSANYPVYPLIMDFLQDSGMVDFILQNFEDHEVLRLRELRSVSSFVENLKKANQATPGVMTNKYVSDLAQLEKHDIAFVGEMVSSAQAGVKILTAHGSKGLEFKNVFIPFCIQEKSWPKREITSKIPLPHELMVGQEAVKSKEEERLLHAYDENRLFYVAATRAKERLAFTAAPQDKQVFTQFLENMEMAPEKLSTLPEEQILIQLLKKGPQIDPVEHTTDTLEGLVEEVTLSPSSVNTYLKCRRQFLYHNLLRSPQPKTQALMYGQCIHKALEKSFRRYMKEGKLPPLKYFEEQFLQELDWNSPEQEARQGCLHKLEDAKRWYQQTLETGAERPLELERKITRELQGGIIFSGQFDKVEPVGKGNEVCIVDYKTGEPDKHIKAIENCDDLASEDCDDYLRQLVGYKLLYERGHRSLRAGSGKLVFLDPVKATVKKYGLEEGVFASKTVQISSEMVSQYEKILGDIWKNIRALEFQRLEKFEESKCGHCPYQGVCWKN